MTFVPRRTFVACDERPTRSESRLRNILPVLPREAILVQDRELVHRRRQGLALFPAGVVQAVADQVHDARLQRRFRVDHG